MVDHKVVTDLALAGLSPRNSLEVLTPEIPGERDRGNCITSLQLHPKGWATLIRCSSNMDDQEVGNHGSQISTFETEWHYCSNSYHLSMTNLPQDVGEANSDVNLLKLNLL